MSRFESCTVGDVTFGICVGSFKESYEPECPSHVVFSLRTNLFDFTHTIYLFCVDESLRPCSDAFGEVWKYYLLRSSDIPIPILRMGIITYDRLRSLDPVCCSQQELERKIIEMLAA